MFSQAKLPVFFFNTSSIKFMLIFCLYTTQKQLYCFLLNLAHIFEMTWHIQMAWQRIKKPYYAYNQFWGHMEHLKELNNHWLEQSFSSLALLKEWRCVLFQAMLILITWLRQCLLGFFSVKLLFFPSELIKFLGGNTKKCNILFPIL